MTDAGGAVGAGGAGNAGGAGDAAGAGGGRDTAGAAPRNYCDPAAEYTAAREDVVIVRRTDRSFIRVHGRDPQRMVQGLVSNDVVNSPADRAVYATILTPKGKMVADTRILRRDGELLLETAVGAADGMAAHLRKFVPPLFARFEDATSAWSLFGVHGPRAADLVRGAFGVEVAGSAEDVVHETSHEEVQVPVIATSTADVEGYDVLVPAAAAERVWQVLQDAGARPIGYATLDVLRIEAGTPVWGAELDENTIPLEAGLRARAISESKGCYTGQEVIIRILHRGHVNWQLRGVLLGDAESPARGTALVREADGKQVGRVTSAAWSPKHGQAIALAYVRREVELPGALRLGDVSGREVTVVELPFA
ncbi:hypothetical protein BH23GEM10_BH23GEM10_01690 [soil metagenome]